MFLLFNGRFRADRYKLGSEIDGNRPILCGALFLRVIDQKIEQPASDFVRALVSL
jgi:hypothetical protein